MTTPKPNAEIFHAPTTIDTYVKKSLEGKRSRAERSAPVRNPAFRENEGLKALQKQLNSRR